MADYLTRLVERTLGLSPAVRPDIPPAFALQTGDISSPVPDSHPPPSYATRRAGAPPQSPARALHHQPPPWLEGESIPPARDEGENPEPAEQGEARPSTSGDPVDLTVTPPARIVRPSGSISAGEGAEIEHHPTVSGQEGDEHPPEPKVHQRRPTPTLPDAASSEDPAEPEMSTGQSRTVANPRGTTPSEPPETPREDREDGDRTRERPSGRSSETRQRPAERPVASRGVASDPRHSATEAAAAPSITQANTNPPPPDAGVHERPVRSARERPATPDLPASPAARPKEPARTDAPLVAGESGTEYRYAKPRAPVERASGPPRESALEPTPARGSSLAPVTDRLPGVLRPVASRQREAAEETRPPTVRITIGRVEVRAIPPEPVVTQPPVEARSEPSLSLEEYLKQPGGVRR